MVLYLGGLIMAYFLRQEKKKKGTYLQMYDSYWDKEKKESRTKSVMAFGYVEELISDELPDPVAYYKDPSSVEVLGKFRSFCSAPSYRPP